jgi:hypothetical protein
MWRLLLISAALWALPACEPAPTQGLYGDQDLGLGEDLGGADLPNQPGGQNLVDFTDMTGTWVQVRDFSTCVAVAGVTETRSRTLLRVHIEQEGRRLVETQEVCALETTPVIGVQTVIPEVVFLNSNPRHAQSFLFGRRPGGLYQSGPIPSVWGIELDNPLTDALPQEGDLEDERITDSDGDGQPGATLKLGGDFCDLWVVQRDVATVSGTLQADGSIEGTGTTVTDQVVLGASNDFCGQAFDTTPNPGGGYFKMVRADARGINLDIDGDGEVSCQEIIDAQESLITWREPDAARCRQ